MFALPAIAQQFVIGAALCAACWVGGYTHERNKNETAKAVAEGIADARAEGLKHELDITKDTGAAARALVADVLGSELERLRNRPPRRVEVIRGGACQGVTGAELSRPDGEFLGREAARAQRILTERDEIAGKFNALLNACSQ
jgi:outer membrane murein-binding lipoprotein Lpp